MNTNLPSNTPITDADEQSIDIGGRGEYILKYVQSDKVRTLERELNHYQQEYALAMIPTTVNDVEREKWRQERNQLRNDLRMCAEALKEISKGKSAYNHDHLKFAINTIKSMKEIATNSLNNPRIQAILNEK